MVRKRVKVDAVLVAQWVRLEEMAGVRVVEPCSQVKQAGVVVEILAVEQKGIADAASGQAHRSSGTCSRRVLEQHRSGRAHVREGDELGQIGIAPLVHECAGIDLQGEGRGQRSAGAEAQERAKLDSRRVRLVVDHTAVHDPDAVG